MSPLLPAAAWLCSAALGGIAVETDVRIAARSREVRAEGSPSRSAGELEAVPRVALLLHGATELALAYAPRLTLPVDLSAGAPEARGLRLRERGEVLHRGEAALDRAVGPNLLLRLRADGATGRVDLRRSEVYVDEVLPRGERLAWRSARAAVEATATPTRRTTLAGGLRVLEAGGADGAARDVVPLQRGARLDAALRHGVTRRDELSFALDGTLSRFSGASEVSRAAIVRVGGGWARSAGPALTGRVAAGAAWRYVDSTLVGEARALTPFAEAGLSHAPARPALAIDLAVRLLPTLNPVAGGVDQRLGASAVVRWRPSPGWELSARASAAAIRGDTSRGAFWTGGRRAELAALDARATFAFARRGTLSLGPRLREQRSHDPTLPTFFEWGATLELAAGARWPR